LSELKTGDSGAGVVVGNLGFDVVVEVEELDI
jgi:hypothetical protein